MANQPPSGRQLEIRHANQRAVVVEVGGGLREYDFDGQPILDGYPLGRMADGGRGQPLLPWPNRLLDGQYEFDGQHLQLPLEEVARHNAIHGLTRWLNWTAVEHARDRVRLALSVHPRPGYPFTLQLSIEYSLSEAGLSVHTTAHNVGQRRLPFGAGQHPYLTVGTPLVDAAVLRVPAARRLQLDPQRLIPTGQLVPVQDSELDFRKLQPIGPAILDACFTDLERDADGLARVVLGDPASGRAAVVWMDSQYRYVQAFSGDTLSPERRRRGLAVEPMTCPPNAFRTGTDLIVLQPEETITLSWGIAHSTLLANV
jgi:aldose 1-epimerase